MRTKLFMLHAALLLCTFLSAKNNSLTPGSNYKTGFGFIENKGQIINQNHQPNPEALYVYDGAGIHVQLRKNGFSYEVMKLERKTKSGENFSMESDGKIKLKHDLNNLPHHYELKVHRVDINFNGGSSDPVILALDNMGSLLNYYTRGMQITGIQNYRKVLYKDVYPFIDIEFELSGDNQTQFKYNFILRPGANFNDIKLGMNGALTTGIDNNRNVFMETVYGKITETIPLSYQPGTNDTKTERKVQYKKVSEGIFGFETVYYDPAQTLVIDPMVYPHTEKYFGSAGDEQGFGISDAGICGQAFSTSSIATSGAYQTTVSGSSDAFVSTNDWTTFIGGNNLDCAYGICGGGATYVAGVTLSDTGLSTTNAYQTASGGGSDGFLASFNTSTGALNWSTYYGGSGNDQINAIHLKSSIVVVGTTASSGMSTSGKYQASLSGASDAFLAGFGNNGIRSWGTYYGGTGDETGMDVDKDLNNNFYITGTTTSAVGIAKGQVHQKIYGGGPNGDAYLAKFTPDFKAIIWSTYYGGNADDAGYGLLADHDGRVYITGYSESTSGVGSNTHAGKADAFAAGFYAEGLKIWGKYYGGTENDVSYCIALFWGSTPMIGGYTCSLGMLGDTSFNANGSENGFYFECNSLTGGGTDPIYIAGPCQTSEHIEDLWSTDWGVKYGIGQVSCDSTLHFPIGIPSNYGGGMDCFTTFDTEGPSSGPTGIHNNFVVKPSGLCLGSSSPVLNGTIPYIGYGPITAINWEHSTIGPDSGFTQIVASDAHYLFYIPPTLTTTTWYRREINAGAFVSWSNTVKVGVSAIKPNPGFSVNSLVQCAQGNNFVFTDTTHSIPSNQISRIWYLGNGDTASSPTVNVHYDFGVQNAFRVTLLSIFNDACSDSTYKLVIITGKPNTGAISGNTNPSAFTTQTYSVPPSMGSTYNWIVANGTGSSTSSTINITWNISGPTTLKVIESTASGCKGDTVTLSVVVAPTSGMDQLNPNEVIRIYPNPSTGLINIECNSGIKYLEAFNALGQVMKSIVIDVSNPKQQIDLCAWSDGIYQIIITDSHGQQHKLTVAVHR